MLSANNSSWAASWLVGSAIVVSATSLSALDANTMGYSSQDSYSQEGPYSQSSGYDGWGEYSYGSGGRGYNGLNGLNGVNGQNGINGINGQNGINGINGINGQNGINGINGINASDEWSEGERSSVSSSYNRGAQNVWSPINNTNAQPFGGATTGGSAGDDGGGDSIRPKRADTPVVPVPHVPVYPAEWNVPESAPGYGPVTYPIYPPTWKYPPLVEKVSEGLSPVGGGGSDVPHRAAPEPLPSPHVPKLSAPEPQLAPSLWTGIVTGVVDFFKNLWPF